MHVRVFLNYLLHLLSSQVRLSAVVSREGPKSPHQRILRFAGIVQLSLRFFKLSEIEIDESPIVAGHYVGSRIEAHQSIQVAQSAGILTVQSMQSGLNKVHHGLVGSLLAHTRNFVAGLLFFAPPQVYKDHQHRRFDQVRIEFERLLESNFGTLKVLNPTEALKNAIDVGSPQAVIG